jgi:hypothetical protein
VSSIRATSDALALKPSQYIGFAETPVLSETETGQPIYSALASAFVHPAHGHFQQSGNIFDSE